MERKAEPRRIVDDGELKPVFNLTAVRHIYVCVAILFSPLEDTFALFYRAKKAGKSPFPLFIGCIGELAV